MSSAELLRNAADALELGDNPFGEHFLHQNEVTADQCLALCQQLAIGARMVANALAQPSSSEGAAMLLSMAREL